RFLHDILRARVDGRPRADPSRTQEECYERAEGQAAIFPVRERPEIRLVGGERLAELEIRHRELRDRSRLVVLPVRPDLHAIARRESSRSRDSGKTTSPAWGSCVRAQ